MADRDSHLYVGLISGTSMDSVDAALVRLVPGELELLATHEHPIAPDLAADLTRLLTPDPPAILAWQLDARIGELFAGAALALLESASVDASSVRAIGSHGQTVYHAPDVRPPCTVQLGDPSIIAERTGITTVADFRRRDLAAGGQGAPLAPALHAHLFSARGRARGILNVGGISNLTVLPADADGEVLGFDAGPGNTLMDLWVARHRGASHDADGRWAAAGRCVDVLLEACLEEPYLALPPPKSTGRELFNMAWLEARLKSLGAAGAGLDPRDVQATLCELTAACVARHCRSYAPEVDELFVCGGGARNGHLMRRLAGRLAPVEVRSTAALGLDPGWVEAVAFAWLARRTLDGEPGNLPSVTGARHPAVLGGIYPAGPLG